VSIGSIGGVVGLFRGGPRDPIGEGGRMSLRDHFRELRARVMRATLYLVVGTIVALFFYKTLFNLVLDPYNQARQLLGEGTQTEAVITGVGTPLMLQLKICGVAAIVGTSPLWLNEIWGFIVPGLHPHERRWTRVFAFTAGPLFVAGVALGYYILPKGISALIGFTPKGVIQLTEFGSFFTFITRMLLVFGISFEIPLFVVMLNMAGVVSGKTLGRYRPWIVVGTFVFAAVATPSTDPYSMLMLAIPMLILVLGSEVISRVLDRRKHARRADDWDDDAPSPI
jgi:sec-independent protein translocase protein TatC